MTLIAVSIAAPDIDQMRARAHEARVTAQRTGVDAVHITLDDDGVGFPAEASMPWSIASRVDECAGSIRLDRAAGAGAHLVIELPVG